MEDTGAPKATRSATSTRKLAANRKNALRSTGPRSAAGLSTSSRNALRHGLRSVSPVVAAVETAEAWEEHRAALFESLAPVGYLEELLAERVAILSWRLDRVVRFETGTLAVDQETAEATLGKARVSRLAGGTFSPDDLDVVRSYIADRGEWEAVLVAFSSAPAETPLSADEVGTVLFFACEEDSADVDAMTAGALWEVIDGWARGQKKTKESVFAAGLARVRREKKALEEDLASRSAELDRYRRTHLVPPAEVTDKIGRYEAHLERSLYRALHEVQRLQEARSGGGRAPLALDVDLTVGRRVNALDALDP